MKTESILKKSERVDMYVLTYAFMMSFRHAYCLGNINTNEDLLYLL